MTNHSQPSFKKTRIVKKLATFVAGLLVSATAYASGGGALLQSGTDLNDRASLQRGAQLYMNYCSGCHSLKYLRYSRMAEDLGLTEDEVMNNLNFTGAKFGEQILVNLTPEHANQWFGKMPPDLSLITRVRGSDWVYTYLNQFYLDESRPLGWNNKLFPNASMPNPLWELQGLQHAEFGEPDETGDEKIEEWELTNSSRVARARRTLSEIYDSGEQDLATLSVAARQIRSMTRTSGTGAGS